MIRLTTLVLGAVLVLPVVCLAAPASETIIVALNCPHGNSDPNCPNRVQDARKKTPPPSKEQVPSHQAQQRTRQEQQRAQQQQQSRQRAQLEQQRAQQQQAQQRAQQEQQRAQQQARLRTQQEQQRAQQEQQRAQQQAQLRAQQEQQRAQQQQAQQRAQQEQQRAQRAQPDAGRPGIPGQSAQSAATVQGQRPPADGRRPGGDVRRPVAPQPVAVDTATSVVPRGDRSSFDIRHKNNDGSQTVISQTRRPDGTRQVTGFKQTEDARNGTTTRIYADGRKSVQGRDFEQRSVQSGMSFVRNQNGLREARLPDGKPSYQDRFASYRDPTGEQRQVIERTQFARWRHGRPVYEVRPVVRYYDVVHIHGAPAPYYRPQRYDPGYFRGYYSRFAVPVALAAVAGAAWVVFDSQPTMYFDPATLLGDMQIASGFEEGYSYAAPSDALPVYDTPEAAALRDQMATVQQQVSTRVQGDLALRQQLGSGDMSATSSQVQQAVGGAVPVQISEDVRQQVRQQARLSVAMLQNGQPLVLADVLASGDANLYLFQTAQPLNVADVSADGECFLNTGDLIGFARLPAGESAVADMKVVASAATSCQPGEVVQVRLTDLQEMLNGFTERVEDNLKRVTACSATGAC